MKFGVIVFPGSNCDHDCYHVLKHVLEQEVVFLWHKEIELKGCDCIVIPGGFSYGDYLRSGAIAGFSPIMNSVRNFAGKGGPVIGICNGFQVLLESGLLPGAMKRNRGLKFICKTVNLRLETTDSVFTSLGTRGKVYNIPVAHFDGNYYADEYTLKELQDSDRIIYRYSSGEGEVSEEYNPNGSLLNIAGICNKDRNVMGMMPHPERCSEEMLGNSDGRFMFESIISGGSL